MSDYRPYLHMCYGYESNLPEQLCSGTIYFTTDTLKMFVDLPVGRTLISTGELVPIYLNEASNPYGNNQDSSDFLPGYQEIKEY